MTDADDFIAHMKANLPEEATPWHSAILEDGQVRPCHVAEALVWLCAHEKDIRVGKTQIGAYSVSTVFSIQNFDGGRSKKPLHFETMIFGPDSDRTYGRYATLEEAKDGHMTACVQAKNLDWNLKRRRQ